MTDVALGDVWALNHVGLLELAVEYGLGCIAATMDAEDPEVREHLDGARTAWTHLKDASWPVLTAPQKKAIDQAIATELSTFDVLVKRWSSQSTVVEMARRVLFSSWEKLIDLGVLDG